MIAVAQPQLETPRLKFSRRIRQFRHLPHREREGVIFVVQGFKGIVEALDVAGANRVHEIAGKLALLGDDTERIEKLSHALPKIARPAPDRQAATDSGSERAGHNGAARQSPAAATGPETMLGAKLIPPPTEPDAYEDEAYRLWTIKQQDRR
jgi:hypothetical protein